MARLFTGDYSTGDFSQWQYVSNVHVPANTAYSLGRAFPPRRFYSMQVISEDTDSGYVARHELRTNDTPYWGGQARCEASDATKAFAPVGSTRWYAFSLKFDPTFPVNHTELGWGAVMNFHDDSPAGYSAPVSFGFPYLPSVANTPNGDVNEWPTGYWFLQHVIWPAPSSPGVLPSPTHIIPACKFPFNLGQWHDLKMEIKWSKDWDGYIRLWWNGEQQTLYGGVDTLYGPTLPPAVSPDKPVTGANVQLGYYRKLGIEPTTIVYNTGFRMADTEDTL